MSVTPRISLVAWEDRIGQFIFVAVPDERGRYLRTDKSVALVQCPHCAAAIGEPCRGSYGRNTGYGATTHAVRRSRARALFGHTLKAGDVIAPEPVETMPDEWMESAA